PWLRTARLAAATCPGHRSAPQEHARAQHTGSASRCRIRSAPAKNARAKTVYPQWQTLATSRDRASTVVSSHPIHGGRCLSHVRGMKLDSPVFKEHAFTVLSDAVHCTEVPNPRGPLRE